jgi:hypothetical protein
LAKWSQFQAVAVFCAETLSRFRDVMVEVRESRRSHEYRCA